MPNTSKGKAAGKRPKDSENDAKFSKPPYKVTGASADEIRKALGITDEQRRVAKEIISMKKGS